MKMLAIETSGSLGGFAVTDDGRLLSEVVSDITGRHVEKGAAMIQYCLESACVPAGALGAVAVSLGPGSFTGLRVGLALAKGLCFATGTALVGVPTLDAMAEGLCLAEGLVAPARDARRGEIFLSVYEARGGRMKRVADYLALPPEAAAEEILKAGKALGSSGPILLAGDALVRYEDQLRSLLGARMIVADKMLWSPRPAVVAALGQRLLSEGKIADLDTIEPLYVRLSEAERKQTEPKRAERNAESPERGSTGRSRHKKNAGA